MIAVGDQITKRLVQKGKKSRVWRPARPELIAANALWIEGAGVNDDSAALARIVNNSRVETLSPLESARFPFAAVDGQERKDAAGEPGRGRLQAHILMKLRQGQLCP